MIAFKGYLSVVCTRVKSETPACISALFHFNFTISMTSHFHCYFPRISNDAKFGDLNGHFSEATNLKWSYFNNLVLELYSIREYFQTKRSSGSRNTFEYLFGRLSSILLTPNVGDTVPLGSSETIKRGHISLECIRTCFICCVR